MPKKKGLIKMDENENKTEQFDERDGFKKKTANEINEAKEQMKNINIKEEAQKGKNLFIKLLKQPINTIKEIAQEDENKTFKTAILLVIIWAASELIRQLIYYISSKYSSFNLLTTLKVTIAPILRVIAMTLSMYIFNKNARKSLSKVLTSVVIANIPSVIASLVTYLNYISSKATSLTSPIRSLLSVITTALIYVTIKALFDKEDDEEAVKAFVKVEAVYYLIAFIISFLGISM